MTDGMQRRQPDAAKKINLANPKAKNNGMDADKYTDTEKRLITYKIAGNFSTMVVGLFAELDKLLANVSPSIERGGGVVAVRRVVMR
ncbi:hypothetical protein T265_01553 [Opisthorchis viverrini]|uniref:Uncharacterized protein n=1 Tax=Opisthorchis viverrini TaxID=6198 RepID=A0A075AIW1_OPIVI|nr:hypothetical protein T265_01553 [Opisthorchis viverrini]KER32324.1 hypothetical protein T265_01553 [Opisthorchis viverrini]